MYVIKKAAYEAIVINEEDKPVVIKEEEKPTPTKEESKPLINIDLSEYIKPDSLIKGIIFTEILSLPKAKRKGMRR